MMRYGEAFPDSFLCFARGKGYTPDKTNMLFGVLENRPAEVVLKFW